MTSSVGLRLGLGLLTTVGLGLTASNLASKTPHGPIADRENAAPSATAPRRLPADSLARQVALHDPFRISRTAAVAPYRLEQAQPSAPTPPSVRPAFALAGLVVGSDSAALIDGLPGTESTVTLRVGERYGPYQLRSVRGDSAVIAGPDTSWTLRVRGRP